MDFIRETQQRDELLQVVSHELRTPITVIDGFNRLLLSEAHGPLSDAQRHALEQSRRSCQRLHLFVANLLEKERLQGGESPPQVGPHELEAFFRGVAEFLAPLGSEREQQLEIAVDPDARWARFDASQIEQVLVNLMGNALKFTEVGHVYVNVSGSVSDDRRAKLSFRIEDTGPGIPEHKCATIFDKFQQVDNSATRAHEGTGLGLSIASSLVDLMGGDIGVESQEGVGSTFWFTIELPVEAEPEHKTKVSQDINGARIVVIDDNQVNRSILAEQMEAWKFQHAELESGAQGLTFMRQAAQHGLGIDLVVLDYQMPGMSGLGVLKEMRADPVLARIPVVLLTSVDDVSLRPEPGDAVPQVTLTKPAPAPALLDAIVEVISEARNGGQPAQPPTFSSLAQSVMGEPRALPVQQPQPTAEREAGAPSGRLDILVAEDNEVNQMLFAQVLKTTRFSFKIVGNGKLAVSSWNVHRPQLILMDVSMPEMNGHEATKAIREAEAETGERVRIIGVTAHALNGDEETCFDAGMDGYLARPISVERLKHVLATHLAPGADLRAGSVA